MRGIFGIFGILLVVFGLFIGLFLMDSESSMYYNGLYNSSSGVQSDSDGQTIWTAVGDKFNQLLSGSVSIPAGEEGYGTMEMLINYMVGDGYCQEYLSILNKFRTGEYTPDSYVVRDSSGKVLSIPTSVLLGRCWPEWTGYTLNGRRIAKSPIPVINGEIAWKQSIDGVSAENVTLSRLNWKILRGNTNNSVEYSSAGGTGGTWDWGTDFESYTNPDSRALSGGFYQERNTYFNVNNIELAGSGGTLPAKVAGYGETLPRSKSDWYYFPDQISWQYAQFKNVYDQYPEMDANMITLASAMIQSGGSGLLYNATGIGTSNPDIVTETVREYYTFLKYIDANITAQEFKQIGGNVAWVAMGMWASMNNGWVIAPSTYWFFTRESSLPDGTPVRNNFAQAAAFISDYNTIKAWVIFNYKCNSDLTYTSMYNSVIDGRTLSNAEQDKCAEDIKEFVVDHSRPNREISYEKNESVYHGTGGGSIVYDYDGNIGYDSAITNGTQRGYIYKITDTLYNDYGLGINYADGRPAYMMITLNGLALQHFMQEMFMGKIILEDMLRYTGLDVDLTLEKIKNAGKVPLLYDEKTGRVVTSVREWWSEDGNGANSLISVNGKKGRWVGTADSSLQDWFNESGVSFNSLNPVQQNIFYNAYTMSGYVYSNIGAHWKVGADVGHLFGSGWSIQDVNTYAGTRNKYVNDTSRDKTYIASNGNRIDSVAKAATWVSGKRFDSLKLAAGKAFPFTMDCHGVIDYITIASGLVNFDISEKLNDGRYAYHIIGTDISGISGQSGDIWREVTDINDLEPGDAVAQFSRVDGQISHSFIFVGWVSGNTIKSAGTVSRVSSSAWLGERTGVGLYSFTNMIVFDGNESNSPICMRITSSSETHLIYKVYRLVGWYSGSEYIPNSDVN